VGLIDFICIMGVLHSHFFESFEILFLSTPTSYVNDAPKVAMTDISLPRFASRIPRNLYERRHSCTLSLLLLARRGGSKEDLVEVEGWELRKRPRAIEVEQWNTCVATGW
jgi:hypothetical protein